MLRLWPRLLSVLLLGCCISANHAAYAGSQNATGWLLTQRHSANGMQQIYVFPQKLRVENTSTGNTLVADSTTGKVWIFNDQRKLMCCVNWDKFEHSFSKIMQVGGENISKLKWYKAKDTKNTVIAGLKTRCFKTTDDKLYFKGGGCGYVAGSSRKVNVEYTMYVADEIRTSPKLLHVLSEMQTTPTLDGVPLREESFYTDTNKLRVFMETKTARQLSEDKKLWVIPKYKEVHTVAEVTNVTDQSFIEDLLGKP